MDFFNWESWEVVHSITLNKSSHCRKLIDFPPPPPPPPTLLYYSCVSNTASNLQVDRILLRFRCENRMLVAKKARFWLEMEDEANNYSTVMTNERIWMTRGRTGKGGVELVLL